MYHFVVIQLQWLHLLREHLLINNACHFFRLTGLGVNVVTVNQLLLSSCKIKIPSRNLV